MAKRKGKRESSIVDGLLVRSSPSQIKTFESCNLKWGYDKVFHLPTKQTKGAEFGDTCHGEIEHWAWTGEDVRGRVPRAGAGLLAPYLHRLPFNKGDGLIEAPLADPCPACYGKPEIVTCGKCHDTGRASDWKVITPGGIRVVGYIDLLLPDLIEPHVIDHKFKKNLEKYGSTETELRRDIQSIIYGKFCLIQFPTAQRVRFTLHEHQTQGRIYARAVSVVLAREEIEREWAVFAALIDGPMRAAARLDKPEQFGRDENKCGAYGGCDFEETCPYSPGNKYAHSLLQNVGPQTVAPQNKDRKNMGLLQQIGSNTNANPPAGVTAKDAKAGQRYKVDGKIGTFQAAAGDRAFFTDANNAPFAVSITAPIEVDAPAVTTPAQSSTPAALTAKDAKGGAFYQVNGKLARFDVQVAFSGQEFSSFTDVQAPAGSPPILVTRSTPITFVSDASATSSPASQPAAVLAPDAPASDPAKATATAQEADEDEEEGGDEAAAVAGASSGVEAEKPKGKPGRKPKAAGSAEGALVLVIDGVATGGGTDLTAYVNEIAGKVAAAAGAKDPRLAGNDTALGYGKWRGFMSEAAKQNPPKGLCYVSRGELADAVIEGLASVASIVVRPVR